MGDAGEGLVDAESRIQERMEEIERERAPRARSDVRDPELAREIESLKLARTELEAQLVATAHERRRAQIQQAIEEISRRISEANGRLV
jgi:septal ring factor EnvC (AmiA/AmiB activator)